MGMLVARNEPRTVDNVAPNNEEVVVVESLDPWARSKGDQKVKISTVTERIRNVTDTNRGSTNLEEKRGLLSVSDVMFPLRPYAWTKSPERQKRRAAKCPSDGW